MDARDYLIIDSATGDVELTDRRGALEIARRGVPTLIMDLGTGAAAFMRLEGSRLDRRFRIDDICRLTALSSVGIDWWGREGLCLPSNAPPGKGTPRLWSYPAALRAATLAALARRGVGVAVLRKVEQLLAAEGPHPFNDGSELQGQDVEAALAAAR